MPEFLSFKDGGRYVLQQADNMFSYELSFEKASGISFPFGGTLVVSSADLPAHEDDATISTWPFYSFRYPRTATEGEGEAKVEKKNFEPLRSFLNKAKLFDKKLHLIFIANDPFYTDTEDNAALVSCMPKYIVVELNENAIIDPGTLPFSKAEGVTLASMSGICAEAAIIKGSIFDAAAGASGTIYAFDAAGMQTDAWSALTALGISVGDNPGGYFYYQYVTLHGDPIPDAVSSTFPELDLTLLRTVLVEENFHARIGIPYQRLSSWPKGPFLPQAVSNGGLYDYPFCARRAGDPAVRFLRLCRLDLRDELKLFSDDAFSSERDCYKNSRFKVFTENNYVKVLNNGQHFMEDLYATARDCADSAKVFLVNWLAHPHTVVPGAYALYGISRCNDSKETVEKKFRALMKGMFSIRADVYPIRRTEFVSIDSVTDVVSGQIWDDLHARGIIDANGMLQPSFHPEDDDGYTLPLDPAFADQRSDIQDILAARKALGNGKAAYTVAFPIAPAGFSGRVHVGGSDHYIRAGERCFFKFSNMFSGAVGVTASWKTEMGEPKNTTFAMDAFLVSDAAELSADSTSVIARDEARWVLKLFDHTWYSIGIDESDPPKAVLRPNTNITPDTIRTALALPQNAILKLLLLNVTANTFNVLPLGEGNIPLPECSSFDTVMAAIVSVAPGEDFLFDPAQFVTTFQQFNYEPQDTANALVPYREQELGGLLRSLIRRGVDVKAMYWDQLLQKTVPAEESLSGESTNLAQTRIINKPISSGGHTRAGAAIVDRSGRALGAFHQKGYIFIDNKVPPEWNERPDKMRLSAYVGGMDLMNRRWDTDNHYPDDPERLSGTWHDVMVRIDGDAVVDVLRNFKQRWDVCREFAVHADPNNMPVEAPPGFEQKTIDTELLRYDRVAHPLPSNAFVQITRTIPPRSPHAHTTLNIDTETEKYPYVGEEGELGCLASYKKAISKARRFIHMEDQYFWCTEIALALRHALLDPNGPQFVILVLPKSLGENDAIDNLLTKQRVASINVLRYGAKDENVEPAKLEPNLPGDGIIDLRDRFAVLSPMSDNGDEVYVHSKHMIVDDVWMSIGSSNSGYRSMTYDFEIDAAIIGKELYKGGTAVVRSQRVELWRRHLNMPESLGHILQDPYSGFRLFKQIEASDNMIPNEGISPFSKVRIGLTDYERIPPLPQNGTVVRVDPGTPEFFWFLSNIFDPDGRTAPENHFMRNILKYVPTELVKLTLQFSEQSVPGIVTELTQGSTVSAKVTVAFTDSETHQQRTDEYYTLAVVSDGAGSVKCDGPGFVYVPFRGPSTITVQLFAKNPVDNTERRILFGGTVQANEIPAMTYPFLNAPLVIQPQPA